MKIIGTFGVTVIASIALLQPAQGRSRGGGQSFSSGSHYSAPAGYSSNGSGSYSGRTAGPYRSSPRYSSQRALRNRAYPGSRAQYAANRTTALRPRVYSASGRRLTAARTNALRSRDFNNNSGRVVGRYSGNWHRNWDRSRDHFWRGHRCHWHNNAWVIYDLGFYPWIYGYGYGYPYGYSYYDGDYYDNGYASSEYAQEYPAQSEYESGGSDSSVSQVQAVLARKGYYHGAIDGSLGPATRSALRRYQRDHGLAVTGQVDQPVIEALGLQ